MEKYLNLIVESYRDYANYFWSDILHPSLHSFFWWTIALSIFFFILEIAFPWRKKQGLFRQDFWLDLFYVFFNFFLFSLLVWAAGQQLLTQLFDGLIGLFGLDNVVAYNVHQLPVWAYYLILFLVGDLVSWTVHRILHRVPWMWEFHKVHHSVVEMGFAAHVRYHWMENLIYWVFRFLPFAVLGADMSQIFAIHVFNVASGHFNHTNINLNPRITGVVFGGLIGLGIAYLYATVWWMWPAFILGGVGVFGLVLGKYMRYILNSPEMHLWHHAWDLPKDRPNGINFGITLAIWDYIFGTGVVPRIDGEIRLGFEGLERFPKNFIGQEVFGFGNRSGVNNKQDGDPQ
jgi:sterol desaturase/sphingolipid hydroxylase (fatty acid hydroxylase superfamily)